MINVSYVILRTISIFQRISAVLNMAVFSSSLMSCFPGMLFRHFLNESEVVQIARYISGIIFVFTFHVYSVFLMSFYFKPLISPFLIATASLQITMSINRSVSISLSRIVTSVVF
jgi:hypothetical protein